MYESMTKVGERGQITIPKEIRKKESLMPKDLVIVKIENGKIIIEKAVSKKEKEALMIEGYKKMTKLDKEIEEELKYISKEADAMLDDY